MPDGEITTSPDMAPVADIREAMDGALGATEAKTALVIVVEQEEAEALEEATDSKDASPFQERMKIV
jgi:hypothetical protein